MNKFLSHNHRAGDFYFQGLIMEKILRIKGAKEYHNWKEGKTLTRKQAMLAQCYVCNGEEESRVDCQSKDSCPMYQYFPHKHKKRVLKTILQMSGDTLGVRAMIFKPCFRDESSKDGQIWVNINMEVI